MRSRVLFPEPFGPSTDHSDPGAIDSESSETTGVVPYPTARAAVWSTGAVTQGAPAG